FFGQSRSLDGTRSWQPPEGRLRQLGRGLGGGRREYWDIERQRHVSFPTLAAKESSVPKRQRCWREAFGPVYGNFLLLRHVLRCEIRHSANVRPVGQLYQRVYTGGESLRTTPPADHSLQFLHSWRADKRNAGRRRCEWSGRLLPGALAKVTRRIHCCRRPDLRYEHFFQGS